MSTEVNYNYLLNEYRTLWNNRLLPADEDAKMILNEAIARELKDENSHPRVRKSSYEKFYLAVNRIMESNLLELDKQQLIQIHLAEMKRIEK